MRDERSPEERQRELEELAAEMTLEPDSLVFSRLAEAYRSAGLPADARRVALHGLERHPGHLPGRISLGLALLDLDRGDEAREVLHDVLGVLEAARAPTLRAAPIPAATPAAASVDGPSSEEIDSAFATAEAEREQMRDAVSVAHEAMRAENLEEPEIGSSALAADGMEAFEDPDAEGDDGEHGDPAGFWSSAHPAFATATMAELLEVQGDTARAREIRSRLGPALDLGEPDSRAMGEARVEAEPEPAAMQRDDEAPATPGAGAGPRALDAAEVPETGAPSAPSSADRRSRVVATLELWLRNIRREVR